MFSRVGFTIFAVGLSVLVYGGEQDRFVESFDGDGQFGSENLLGPETGLDNPGWQISGTAELSDGGLWLPTEDTVSQLVWRSVTGSASFRNEIHLKDIVLNGDESAISSPLIMLNHTPGIDEGNSALGRLSIGVAVEGSNAPSVFVNTGGRHPSRRFFYDIADRSLFEDGTDITLAIEFLPETMNAYFEYDLNTNDNVPATVLGPFMYEGEVTESQNTKFNLSRGFEVETNIASGLIDSWSLSDYLPLLGDYDGDKVLTGADIDLLSAEVLAGTNQPQFDLNVDGLVNEDDRRTWVHDLAKTSFGDANLDGTFDNEDLVAVFQAAEYEDLSIQNSLWSEGDWSGDREFSSTDLVVAFQDGQYDGGQAAMLVPEPSYGPTLLLFFLTVVAARISRR